MVNYTKKALKASSLVFIMTGISSFLAYFIRIIIARNLSPADYGLFYAIFTLFMFFFIFRNIGLGKALIKFIAEYNIKKDYSKIKTLITATFIFQFLSSTVLAIALICTSSFLSTYYFKTPLSSKIIFILIIYIYTSFLSRFIDKVLRGFQDAKWYSIAESLGLIFAISFTLLFFQLGFEILSPALGYVLGSGVAFLILLIGASKYFFVFKYKLRDFWRTTKQLFSFGIPFIFTGVGNKVLSHLDVLILTSLVSLKAVGIYNTILPTAVMFLVFGKAISTVLLPMVSELWSKGDKNRVSEGIRMIYTYSFVLAVPFLLAIFTFSGAFIRLLFGSEYVAGILAFRILLIGILFYTVAMINNTAISGLGKPKIVTKIILISAAINVILNLVLIPPFKITGAAMATSLSYLIILTLSTISLTRHIQLATPWKLWLKISSIGVIFATILFSVKNLMHLSTWLEVTIGFVLASIVYVFLIWKMKIINFDEIRTIIKRVAL